MPDSPLLTPEALAAVTRRHFPLVRTDDHVIRVRVREQAEADVRAFLAAHDPEVLAERFRQERPNRRGEFAVILEYNRWLGLGGDDA